MNIIIKKPRFSAYVTITIVKVLFKYLLFTLKHVVLLELEDSNIF